METESKKTPMTMIILLVVGVCLISICIWYFNRGNNNSAPESQTTNEEGQSTVNNPTYVGEYEVDFKPGNDPELNPNGIEIYQLILRDDNTFVYNTNIVAYEPLVGTYEVNGDSIILTGTVRYGSDVCFFTTSNVYTINGVIKDDHTISITNSDETLDYKKNLSFVEEDSSKKWYVTNPVDGVNPNPSHSEETWRNCD